MLKSVVFILRPTADTNIPTTVGNAVYPAVLDMIGSHDADLATWLHDAQGAKPLTTSPLQGFSPSQGGRIHVQHDRIYWLRATSLEARLSQALDAVVAQPPPTLRLYSSHFTIEQICSQPAAHPWAATVPYEALYATALQYRTTARAQVSFDFVSPTVFRSQGRSNVFPLPRLVFGSLLKRWNTYAPVPLENDLIEIIDTWIDVDRHTLTTKMHDFGRYQLQVGFVGQCTFGSRNGTPPEAIWGMRLLATFAFFAGVGYRTMMGMGQVKPQV